MITVSQVINIYIKNVIVEIVHPFGSIRYIKPSSIVNHSDTIFSFTYSIILSK